MQRTSVISESSMSRSSWFRLSLAALLLCIASSSLAQGPPAGAPPGGGPPRQAPPPTPPTAGAHLEIVEGSASYKVTEQFVGINFPNDAIGTTNTVAGSLTIAADGSIAPGSKLSFDLRTLKSDQEQRDGYVRTRALETDKFPMAEFVPTKIKGLAVMIPTQGQTGFELTGNMTIHGVTKEVTFQGIATFNRDSTVAGRAKTEFTFDTFGIAQPKIARLMSVDNKVILDLVFKFKRS
jgi:polyisoprenoid-binding protein YceI